MYGNKINNKINQDNRKRVGIATGGQLSIPACMLAEPLSLQLLLPHEHLLFIFPEVKIIMKNNYPNTHNEYE